MDHEYIEKQFEEFIERFDDLKNQPLCDLSYELTMLRTHLIEIRDEVLYSEE